MMRSTIGVLATAAIVAAGAVLLGVALLYPVDRQVGGVNELTFTRTGGFIGLNERLHIKEDGTAEYFSNRFGNATIHLDKSVVDDLFNKTGFFTANKTYNPVPGAADYFFYGLDVQKGFNVTTIQWVDAGVSKETLPQQLLDIQSQIENIILRARNTTTTTTTTTSTKTTTITTTTSAGGLDTKQVTLAKNFIIQAPTFKFDGITETLNVTDAKVLESFPEQYVITITFESRYAGYGNRTGQVLAQVITSHTAVVTVVNNTVTSAIIDGKWDELRQKPVTSGEQMGTVSGKVIIGPLCPVEPCPGPVPDVYSSRYVVLQPEAGGEPTRVKLSSNGSFEAQVKPGTYNVDLTDCTFLGCSRVLPTTVTVKANETTNIQIDIDTGIR